jgi:GNAT superfamily N-acetyltransferase
MQIVRARPEEADALTEIAYSAKRHWGYPERWIERWRDILTIRPEFIAANVAHAALENGLAVGFYVLTNEADGIRLDHLWILPAAMHRGILKVLFKHAVEQTRELGFRAIRIEADPNADEFYKRMGAKRIGTSTSKMDGETRELPLLIYQLEE